MIALKVSNRQIIRKGVPTPEKIVDRSVFDPLMFLMGTESSDTLESTAMNSLFCVA